MPWPLSRSYVCRYGAPVLDRVDPRIFELTYFAHCLECSFCDDACCQYGVDIELPRVEALEQHQAELEQYLGVSRDYWFREDPEDVGYLEEPEYPGGVYTRTGIDELPAGRSAHNEYACVFLDPRGRGCRLHRFALERGIDVHTLKPMLCLLFPLSFGDGELKPSLEFDLNDLVCQGSGVSLYQSARPEVLYYFGPELVEELDRLERRHAAAGGGALPLPVSS